mmetsp:Transcript_66798/g.196052  ORF Transcript_66798/g.196052 Transcript_66798/m.196052 type:complete len:419 (-) Transcript_66798:216-1472(-)
MPLAAIFRLGEEFVHGLLRERVAAVLDARLQLLHADGAAAVVVEVMEGLPVHVELFVAQLPRPQQALREGDACWNDLLPVLARLLLLAGAAAHDLVLQVLCPFGNDRAEELHEDVGESVGRDSGGFRAILVDLQIPVEDAGEALDLLGREAFRVPVDVQQQNHFFEVERAVAVHVHHGEGLLHHLAEGCEPEEGQELHQLLLVEGATLVVVELVEHRLEAVVLRLRVLLHEADEVRQLQGRVVRDRLRELQDLVLLDLRVPQMLQDRFQVILMHLLRVRHLVANKRRLHPLQLGLGELAAEAALETLHHHLGVREHGVKDVHLRLMFLHGWLIAIVRILLRRVTVLLRLPQLGRRNVPVRPVQLAWLKRRVAVLSSARAPLSRLLQSSQRGGAPCRVRRSRPPKLRIGARGGLLTTLC